MGLPRVRPHPPLQIQYDPKQVQRDRSGRGTEEQVLKSPIRGREKSNLSFGRRFRAHEKANITFGRAFAAAKRIM